MFEEGGVGAEEVVSSEEYVTYTVPSNEVNLVQYLHYEVKDEDFIGMAFQVHKSEYDLLGAHYTSGAGVQATGNVEIRDAIANIGVMDCQEEEVQTHYKTAGVQHAGGDVHYEIKSEPVSYDDAVASSRVFFSNAADTGAPQVYKVGIFDLH